MSFLQYPEAINNSTELQVWNNAAFDGEQLQAFSFPMKSSSWSSLHPVFETQSDSLGSDCSKENLNPSMANSPVSSKSSIPIKPFHSTTVIGNSQTKPTKGLARNGGSVQKKGFEEEEEEEEGRKIDAEIEEIENEIKRLSSRLEALRLQKAENLAAKMIERRGRIVPAKFMEPPKQSVKVVPPELVKKIDEAPLSSAGAKMKMNRRGVSLGPAEIVAGAGSRSRVPGKLDVAVTPVQAIQSRRKSCFWKLQEIDEGKTVSERRKSGLSLSPKSRKIATVGRIQAQSQRQAQAATTTVGSRKCVKKEDGVFFSLIQPRKLFKDGGKSVPAKKPLMKPGRVVASRYNQVDARKRSLPENDKEDDGKRCDKRRASSVGKSRGNGGSEVRIKKRWEIPTGIVVYKSGEEEEKKTLSSSIANMTNDDVLPKIRTIRCANNESPRDSGAAKRVAELIGKRSYFCPDEDVGPSVCQALSFAEEDADEEG